MTGDWRLAVVAAIAVLSAACGDAASTTTAPVTARPTTTTTDLMTTTSTPVTSTAAPAGPDRGDVADLFSLGSITVGGEDWTVAVADTREERSQGLMFVTDLGDLDGMLFVFGSDNAGGFWMKDTLIPLEVAFFTVDGDLVDVLAMVPCEADPCPAYTPGGSYRYALEAVPGRLGGLPGTATLSIDG